MHIAHPFRPNIEEVNFLTIQLNQAAEGFKAVYPFGFFIRDEAKQVKAGVNGSIIYGVIYVDQLWEDVDYRNRGLGHQLKVDFVRLGYASDSSCILFTQWRGLKENVC